MNLTESLVLLAVSVAMLMFGRKIEIFVRINNQGTRLGQPDFVLTLLSVFHGELRDRIEERARAMSQGLIIGGDTQQLLRAA